MDKKEALGKKERFLKLYGNLPVKLREEFIYILPGKEKQPLSWNAAFIEVINNTTLGEQILTKLDDLDII